MPKRRLIGTVSSNKMNKAVVVKVETTKIHPKYQKRFKVSKKYSAAAKNGQFQIGDRVEIEESKPISKTINWVVIRKLE